MSAREGKIQTEHEGFRGVESGDGLTGGPVPSAVGAMLRATRQRFGWDLEDIERSLRIRLVHLQAIEEGRFEDLPGPAYAVGFVRAYADHLGLDREEVVNQFREEISDLPKRIRLNFPTPIPESRVPSGAIILVAIGIAITAYGGWYFLSMRHRGSVETVAEVPKQLAEMFKPGLDSGDSGTGTTPPSEAAAAPTSQPENAPPAIATGPATTAPASSAPAASESSTPPPATSATSSASPASTTAPAALTAPGPVAAQSAHTAPAMAPSTSAHAVPTPSGNAPAGNTPASNATSSNAPSTNMPSSNAPPISGRSTAESAPANAIPAISESTPAAPAAPSTSEGAPASDHKTTNEASLSEQFGTLPTSPDQGPAEGQGAQVFGKANTNVRIVIRANSDSWVQVRDNDGALILTRMLRAGDSYRVPNKSGLTLLTGNAGALEVYVDGRLAPPLGPGGAIRRDVSLDADRLMAGTAVDN